MAADADLHEYAERRQEDGDDDAGDTYDCHVYSYGGDRRAYLGV